MFGRARKSLIMLLVLYETVSCRITGPKEPIICNAGDDVRFRWRTDDNSTIFSATGIKKANIADPQFINVDIRSKRVYLNYDLEPDLIKRIAFDGDLGKGLAWFTLKNVAVNDTNVYLASISDIASRVLPYAVELTVLKKDGDDEAADAQTTTNETKVLPSRSPGIVNGTKQGSTQGAGHQYLNNEYLIFLVVLIAIVVIGIVTLILVKKRCVQGKTDGSEIVFL